jgi:hypothetical protein
MQRPIAADDPQTPAMTEGRLIGVNVFSSRPRYHHEPDP